MPADSAVYIRAFQENLSLERRAKPSLTGIAMMLGHAEKDHSMRRFILAVPTRRHLDVPDDLHRLSRDILDRLVRHGEVDYVDPEFPDSPVKIHLMTEEKAAPPGKLPVLAIFPTAALLEQIHERNVSELVVVPWQESDIEEWRNKQCPEGIDLPD